jgi:hypothetical protein
LVVQSDEAVVVAGVRASCTEGVRAVLMDPARELTAEGVPGHPIVLARASAALPVAEARASERACGSIAPTDELECRTAAVLRNDDGLSNTVWRMASPQNRGCGTADTALGRCAIGGLSNICR